MTQSEKEELVRKIKDVDNIKGIYNHFVNEEVAIIEDGEDIKDLSLKVREDIARVEDMYKSNGDLAVSEVNSTSFKGALSVYDGGIDKLDEANDQKNKILGLFRSGEIDQSSVKSLIKKETLLSDKKKLFSSSRKEQEVQYDPDVIKGVYALAKVESKIIYESKHPNENSSGSAEKKRDSFDLLMEIKKALGLN